MAAHILSSRFVFSSAFWSVNASSQQALVDILDGGDSQMFDLQVFLAPGFDFQL